MGDKMAEDVTNLKNGVAVSKPIYNHITGELDPNETVEPTPIVIFEGLHPMHDERVNKALDLTIYLDITDNVKFAWKAQRDIAERGATMEEVKKAVGVCEIPYLFDQGSKIEWTPNGEKLSVKEGGVVFKSYDDEWFGEAVSVIEMDGAVDVLDELVYVESAICNSGTKNYGELTEQMVKNADAPGSENGTGLFQTLASFKIREAYESITKSKYAARCTA